MKYISPFSKIAFLNKFVNLIVSDFPNKNFIEATDFHNFIVVKGLSNDKELVDLTTIKDKMKEKYPEYFSNRKHFNIIDLIDYKNDFKINTKNFCFDYFPSFRPIYNPSIFTFLENFKWGTAIESVDYREKFIVECDEKNKNEFIDFVNFECPTLSYKSTFPNGFSNNSLIKILFFYGEYIAYNLFKILITPKITLKFQISSFYQEFPKPDEINIKVISDSQYKNSDVESLVKDIFDLNLKKFKIELLDEYDFQREVDFPIEAKPWLKHDKGKDLFIF